MLQSNAIVALLSLLIGLLIPVVLWGVLEIALRLKRPPARLAHLEMAAALAVSFGVGSSAVVWLSANTEVTSALILGPAAVGLGASRWLLLQRGLGI